MVGFADWFPLALVGSTFTAFGLLKAYGLCRGVQGGGHKPLAERICGSCPSWSRGVNVGMMLLFLAVGLGNLAWLVWLLTAAQD